MAMARERAEWQRAAVAVAFTVNRSGMAREAMNPAEMIPAQFRVAEVTRRKTAEEVESESRLAWHVLDTVFGGKK